ncbi:hypothetical protein BLNAU_4863 [Blattamonas nauphoetae]|uniref:Uncharacterized protein n=1 Tax=Blattamonas nauphoetae TaxID=2049346 RepID=A0ABQ9Y978_9EUKA|nr:hypothetical protein BLNAU_4863 [Blattamonas nauphoetae]
MASFSSFFGKVRSLWPFNRDAHRDVTPIFLQTPFYHLNTLKQATPSFLSLVAFVKEGNNLDENAASQAYEILDWLTPRRGSQFNGKQILFDLVPKPDGSCSGFIESVIPLLTSSDKKLVRLTLTLLRRSISFQHSSIQYKFIENGFFTRLPQTFYEQEMHLLAEPELILFAIVDQVVDCTSPIEAREICKFRQISMETFQNTLFDKFLRPIGPFLEFICINRRRIMHCKDSRIFWSFLNTIWENSFFLEEMTQFVLSSSFSLLLTDFLHFFETESSIGSPLWKVWAGVRTCLEEDPAVKKRGQLILVKLCAEGLHDEFELHIRCCDRIIFNNSYASLGPLLIHVLGGNIPFLSENEH